MSVESKSHDGAEPRRLEEIVEAGLEMYWFFAGEKGNLRAIPGFAVHSSGEEHRCQALPDDRAGLEKHQDGSWVSSSTGVKISSPDDFSFVLNSAPVGTFIRYKSGELKSFLRFLIHLASVAGSAAACAVPHGIQGMRSESPARPAPQDPDDTSELSCGISEMNVSSNAAQPSSSTTDNATSANAMSRFSRLLQSPGMNSRMANWRADLSPREFITDSSCPNGFRATIRVFFDNVAHVHKSDPFPRIKDARCDAVDRFLRAIDR